MTFAQPIKNINLIRNDSLASGSEVKPKNTTVVVGLPGTQWLKSASNQQLFRVCVLSDKMNCTVGFGKLFPVSSPSLPWQYGTRQQSRAGTPVEL